jgi:hypothetical protein
MSVINIADKQLMLIFFSVLVDKLGGTATIAQVDIDKIAYSTLLEQGNEDGSLTFTIKQKE